MSSTPSSASGDPLASSTGNASSATAPASSSTSSSSSSSLAWSRKRLISITPLVGSGVDGGGPRSCLIKLTDGPRTARILVDCGWDSQFKESTLSKLKDAVEDEPIDLILLSFGDLEHVGALPVVIGRLGVQVRGIFCTLPTLSMGQQACYEAHECHPNSTSSAAAAVAAVAAADAAAEGSAGSRSGAGVGGAGAAHAGGFHAFTLNHVDAAFSGIRPLKYNEDLTISDFDLTITPFNAGRGLGGSLWRFRWQTDEILYAVDINPLNKELHLSKSALSQLSSRPSLLITDSTNWGCEHLKGGKTPKSRQEELRKQIFDALQRGGNVLLPTDVAGRSLELLLLLDQMWANSEQQLPTYCRLVFLHSMARNVLTLAKCMTEWMSEDISLKYNPLDRHPFNLRHVEIFHSVAEFDHAKRRAGDNRPCVVLTTHGSLEMGPGRDLLARWASDPRNKVIFTSRAPAGSTSARLQTATVRPLVIGLTVWVKKLLEGRELEEWERQRQAERDEAQRASDQQRFIDEIRQGGLVVDDDLLSSIAKEQDDDEDDEEEDGEEETDGALSASSSSETAMTSMDVDAKAPLTPNAEGRSLSNVQSQASGLQRTESASLEIGSSRKANARARSSSFGGGSTLVPAVPSSGGGRSSSSGVGAGSGGVSGSARGAGDGGTASRTGRGKNAKRRKITASSFMYYATPRHVMFGALEPQVKQDIYGADIPEEVLGVLRHRMRKSGSVGGGGGGGVIDAGGGPEAGSGGGGGGDDDPLEDDDSAPYKFVREARSLAVRCATPLVDMEGRPNWEGVKNTLRNLRPRRLVVAYGPNRASQELKMFGCSPPPTGLGIEKNLSFAPGNGTSASLDLDSRSYEVLLHDRIMNQLESKAIENVRGIEVSHVKGIVQKAPASIVQKAKNIRLPKRLIAPDDNDPNGGHVPILISSEELKILTVKKMLLSNSGKLNCIVKGKHPNQLLLCSDPQEPAKKVVVRYDIRTRKLQIEGGLCSAYFSVRRAIYSALALV